MAPLFLKWIGIVYFYEIVSSCTLTARPDGSAESLKSLSQAKASAVLQAIDGTDGTLKAAVFEGKCSAKIER